MSGIEDFFNHPLLIWELLVWSVGFALFRIALVTIWRKGKKKGINEFDDYKKWEAKFKDDGWTKK